MGGLLLVWLFDFLLGTLGFFLSLAGWRIAKKNVLPKRMAVAGMVMGGIPMVLLFAFILRMVVGLLAS